MRTRYISNPLHLENSTCLYGPHLCRTGFIEGAILMALTSAGVSGAALGIGVTLLTGTVSIGLSVGLSYLAQSLFRPSAPRPEDVQQSIRQPTAARVRHYGRVKASGPWVFAEAEQGNFHKVLALGQGPIDGIEQFWLDDTPVALDPDGHPTSPSKWRYGTTGDPIFRILHRLGEATVPPYAELGAAFAGWTADHRGNGVASLYTLQRAVGNDLFMSLFPNGINTSYRVVMRGVRVQNPITSALAWSDNAAAIIRDYLTHADGMRLPASVVSTPLAHAGWIAAFNRAAQAVPLAAGGSEPRYRLWGSYQLNERPADVLGRMLLSSDARFVPTPDGGLTLDIGAWAEPTVTIGPDAITGFSELGRGRDVLSTANTIRATYLEPSQDYQAAEADPWADEADVSERGEIASDIQLHMSPSHSQTRRLMKLAAYRANPNWVGTFQCNLRALAAVGERLIRIQYPLFGINSVFEVQDLRFNIGEGGVLTGVTLQVQSMPAAAYQWDPSQEGTAPVMDESEGDDSIPVPAAPVVDLLTGPLRAELSFPPSPSPILFYQARHREVGEGWTVTDNLPIDTSGITVGPLDAATAYEFGLRLVTEKGRQGEWGPAASITTP